MTSILQHSDWLNGRVPDTVRLRLRQLIEVVGYLPHRQPLAVITADAVLLAANRPFLDLLGTSADEQLGADWDDFMPGWSARTGASEPRIRRFEDYLMPAGSEPAWVRAVACPVFAPAQDGEDAEALAAWALFVLDRRPGTADAGERRRRDILELLLEIPDEFVVQLAADGTVEYVSPSLRRALGVFGDGVEGRPLAEVHALCPDAFRDRFERLMERLTAPPYLAESEMRMTTSGAERVVAWRFESMLADGGAVRGILGVGHDITGRKAAEESVRRRARLEADIAAVSRCLAGAKLETVGPAADFALAELGRLLGVDRACCYVARPDRMSLASVRVWRAGTQEVGEGDAALDVSGLHWLRELALAGGHLSLRSLDELPEEAAPECAALLDMGVRSLLAVPLLQERTLVGLLAFEMLAGAGRPDPAGEAAAGPLWTDEDVSLVRVVADQLAGLLVWSWDEDNLRRIGECFLSFGPEVDDNLGEICRTAGVILAADAVLYSRRRAADLVTVAGWGVPEGLPAVTPLEGRVDQSLFERPGETVRIVRDLQRSVYARSSAVVESLGSDMYAGFPVLVGGRVVAVLSCLFARDVQLRESQLELMRVLGRAAAVEEERRRALEERLLGLAQLEQAMERTVTTLSAAMGRRDPYTIGHERRVADLSAAIGAEMGMDPHDLRLLRLAAAVHDIGKITLPAEILAKPTRLSDAEYELIKKHSEAGWEMLEPAGLPVSVTDAVLQHHERLDGSGYPAGLRGDQIGGFARVIAVADVVEAMSSHRPYRPAIGIEPALAEIEGGRGVRYDAQAADACLRLFREKGFTLEDEGRPE